MVRSYCFPSPPGPGNKSSTSVDILASHHHKNQILEVKPPCCISQCVGQCYGGAAFWNSVQNRRTSSGIPGRSGRDSNRMLCVPERLRLLPAPPCICTHRLCCRSAARFTVHRTAPPDFRRSQDFRHDGAIPLDVTEPEPQTTTEVTVLIETVILLKSRSNKCTFQIILMLNNGDFNMTYDYDLAINNQHSSPHHGCWVSHFNSEISLSPKDLGNVPSALAGYK